LVTEQNIESVLLKTLLERFDAARVEPFYGEKPLMAAETTATNEPVIPEPPLQPPVNTNLALHYVEDTAADQDESGYFEPVEDVLDFDGQNHCQQDIAVKNTHPAIPFGYHDATDHGDDIFERMPSPTIINRRVREYGSKLKQSLPERVSDTPADAVIPDGTKCHSQDDDRTYTLSRQRSARTLPATHAPCSISR